MIRNVTEATWAQDVVARSKEVPVVVDFWAEWCGPCRQLGPALEAATRARGDKIDLAKVDVDANQHLAAEFRVQGIPAVKAFKDGKVAGEFTGALPPAQVEEFFDTLVPSEADGLAASDDETDLRRSLELDPRQSAAARKIVRILLQRNAPVEAIALGEQHPGDFVCVGLAARGRLQLAGNTELDAAWEAWDSDDPATALEILQNAFASADADTRDRLRQAMVAIFTELGSDHELAREHRRRLSAAM